VPAQETGGPPPSTVRRTLVFVGVSGLNVLRIKSISCCVLESTFKLFDSAGLSRRTIVLRVWHMANEASHCTITIVEE
jgi:hypothetical protein